MAVWTESEGYQFQLHANPGQQTIMAPLTADQIQTGVIGSPAYAAATLTRGGASRSLGLRARTGLLHLFRPLPDTTTAPPSPSHHLAGCFQVAIYPRSRPTRGPGSGSQVALAGR
ncbi:hypothetical protein TcWFU_006958 [Taenia crassiceps]|uniref:Uncharacterized protein n=1 Tax=Taenia crassiceps TaxID=6207 RepID=A0ABR4QEE4_9CEST